METWCNGWVVNILDQDKALFIENYVTERQTSMGFSFAPLKEVKLNGSRYQAQHAVFNNQDLMNKIFTRVHSNQDKANMAIVCRNWSQLFLVLSSAPHKEVAYWMSLQINDVNGVRIIRRGPRIVHQRCKCFMTDDKTAKLILHYRQQQNRFQSTHLNDLDDTAIRQVNELLHDLATPSQEQKRSIAIASHLLTRATLSYLDLPLLIDI